jgi:hypothetical protein
MDNIDKNSVGVNITMDNNTKHVAFGFYVVVVFIAFVRLITSFKSKGIR